MKKIWKLGIGALIASCVFLLGSLACFASESTGNAFYMEKIAADIGVLDIYGYEIGEQEINRDNLEIRIDGNIKNILDIRHVNLQVDAYSYYCLVDVSGSLDANRINEVKKMINSLIDMMKDYDTMCVATIADEFEKTGFISDKEVLRSFVDGIVVKPQNTNLYTAVKSAIQSLNYDDNVNPQECLIIFSDGADYQANGITKDEVIDVIKSNKIPVYTVAMIYGNANAAQLESAKILGSFARTSPDGIHFAPALTNQTYDEVPGHIIENIQKRYCISCQLLDIYPQDINYTLQSTSIYSNGSQYSDSLTVAADLLEKYIEYTPEPEPEPEPEAEPEEEELEDEEDEETEEKLILGMPPTIFGLVSAIVVIIFVIIILLIINSRKKSQPEPMAAPMPMPEPMPEPMPDQETKYENVPVATPTLAEPKITKNNIKLYRIKSKDSEYLEIKFDSVCRIGRDSSKCDFVIENDKAISGLHCTISYHDGGYYVKDENSSNGTYLNGIPVEGEYKLNQDDILYIGSYEYRLMW